MLSRLYAYSLVNPFSWHVLYFVILLCLIQGNFTKWGALGVNGLTRLPVHVSGETI